MFSEPVSQGFCCSLGLFLKARVLVSLYHKAFVVGPISQGQVWLACFTRQFTNTLIILFFCLFIHMSFRPVLSLIQGTVL